LLLFFVRITYGIVYAYQPEWAFLPSTALAYMIFKSRIKKLMTFLKALYKDKKEMLRIRRKQLLFAGVAVVLLATMPIWRESIEQRLVLEPVRRAELRSLVPGIVVEIAADEGMRVASGQRLAVLQDSRLESELAKAEALFARAQAGNFKSQLQYVNLAEANQNEQQMAEARSIVREKHAQLEITSPIAGTVASPRAHDLIGSYVTAGTMIAEVVDTSSMIAHVYVQESELRKVQSIEKAVLRLDSSWSSMAAEYKSWSPVSRELAPGLAPTAKYKGMHPPIYYVLEMRLPNQDGRLRTGMTGTAKIYGKRVTAMELVFRPIVDALARRVW
jgi:multidrug resistance efflux pump